jgi:hypothetical protein
MELGDIRMWKNLIKFDTSRRPEIKEYWDLIEEMEKAGYWKRRLVKITAQPRTIPVMV